MTRERAFSASRLVMFVLVAAVVAVVAVMAVNFVGWLQGLKSSTSERMDSHARQLEVLVS